LIEALATLPESTAKAKRVPIVPHPIRPTVFLGI
jgi:hypothetical protein